MNIKFNYLYRDGANYKQYGFLIFDPGGLSLSEIEKRIREALIDGEFFDPVQWDIPRLKFAEWNEELDHGWNEFEGVKIVNEELTVAKSISEFIACVNRIKNDTPKMFP